jgi:hypothetical protein
VSTSGDLTRRVTQHLPRRAREIGLIILRTLAARLVLNPLTVILIRDMKKVKRKFRDDKNDPNRPYSPARRIRRHLPQEVQEINTHVGLGRGPNGGWVGRIVTQTLDSLLKLVQRERCDGMVEGDVGTEEVWD